MELWDYMLAGIPTSALDEESLATPCYDLLELAEDPFNQLEFSCLAMIVAKREELLESDFSMCLGTFMKYDEPKMTNSLTQLASKLKTCLLTGSKFPIAPRKPVQRDEENEPQQCYVGGVLQNLDSDEDEIPQYDDENDSSTNDPLAAVAGSLGSFFGKATTLTKGAISKASE